MTRIKALLWAFVAWIVTRPYVRLRLMTYAYARPYLPIMSPDGKTLYMGRFWIFNPYHALGSYKTNPKYRSWLPSVRLHHICMPDGDRHLHNHPWDARTIVLGTAEGEDVGYVEERPQWKSETAPCDTFERRVGYTGRLQPSDFHRISRVAKGGVFTLFITWRKQQSWGFLVGRETINHKTYAQAFGTHDPSIHPTPKL